MFLTFANASALAIDTYDTTTNLYNIDSVVVGGTQYNNVVLRLKSFDVVSVGSSAPYGGVSSTCSSANLTVAHFNAIVEGMTLNQVNQAFGCTFDPSYTYISTIAISRTWQYGTASINVWFDASGNTVAKINGVGDFKTGFGLY
jgi:hypothetical protein